MKMGKTNWRPRKRYNTYRSRGRRRVNLRTPHGSLIGSRRMEISRKWGSLRTSDYWFKHKV